MNNIARSILLYLILAVESQNNLNDDFRSLGGGVEKVEYLKVNFNGYEAVAEADLTVWAKIYRVVFSDDREVVTDVDRQSDYGGFLVYRENFVTGFKRIEALDKNLKVI